MGGARKSIGMLRKAMWPALAVVIVGNFATYAVAGPNGLLAWGGYSRTLETRKVELAKLEQHRAELRHRSVLLDPKGADPDLSDELVRRDLGLVRPDEVVLPLE